MTHANANTSIWKTRPTLELLNHRNENTINAVLGIEFTSFGEDFIEARMPVDARTKQPLGLLHGGASAVLAEGLGSVASVLVTGGQKICVGIELNASHLKAMRSGFVIGRVTPIRLGKSLHVWRIQIRDGNSPSGSLICESRLSVMVRDRPENPDTSKE